MQGSLAALFRHPVKGFTPESLAAVDLAPERGFPFDRVWAVENGPSGFDAAAPAFVSKQKFTVLASLARVAAARTRYDDATGLFHAQADGLADFAGRLSDEAGRAAFADWVGDLLGDEASGPLKVLQAPPSHRFTDNIRGQVSVINLASVRDLAQRMGVEIDPLRFRANLYVEGWAPWAEMNWTKGSVTLGPLGATVLKPIVRCAATHVNPLTAERDLEIVRGLFDHYGHTHCGLYLNIVAGGRLSVGDACIGSEGAPHA